MPQPDRTTTSSFSPATNVEIRKKIRFLIQNHSLTFDEMANRLGITSEHFRYIIDGLSQPTPHLLEKICVVFNLRPDYFRVGPATQEGATRRDRPQQGSSGPSKPARPGAARQPPAGPSSRKPSGVGVLPATDKTAGEKKRRFDLAELAAHHQALLECLLEKKLIRSEEYQKKLKDVRSRAGLE